MCFFIQKARLVRSGEPVVADPTPITSVAGTFCSNAGEYQPSTGSLAPASTTSQATTAGSS